MNAKFVVVRDGYDDVVGDHEALYVDGKKEWEGAVEDHKQLLVAAKKHGATESDLRMTNLGERDVQILIDHMQFPETLSDFTDTDIPSEDDTPPETDCGCGPSCKGCGTAGSCSTEPAEEDPDVASPPRPQQKVVFVPNDPEAFFKYEENEYQLALERLRRYAEDWPEKRDALAEAVGEVDPEKQGSLNKLISETSSVVQAVLMQQWAKEVMDKTEKDGEAEDVAVDENGHKVNEQECPHLLWNLQMMRHSLAKTLIDSTRQGANAADLTGVVNNEALSAMTTFIDDFVHICPSLRKVDLGNKDPLRNTL